MSTPEDQLGYKWLENSQIRAFEAQQLAIGNQVNIDSDRAMRSMAVGQYTGLALNLIDANLEELEEELKKNQNFDPDAWKRESPGFAAYAAEHPYHLSVLKMDNENLTKWERNWRAISLSLDSTWAKVEANYISKRQAHGIFYDTDTERLAEYEKLLQPHTFGAESFWARQIVNNAKEIGPMWYSIRNTADEIALGIGAGMLTHGLMAAPAIPVTGGISEIVGLGTGAVAGGYTGFRIGIAKGSYDMITGESYRRYIDAGFTHENAATAAKAAGLAGAVAEPFGIGMLFRYIPGAQRLVGKSSQLLIEKLTGQILAQKTVKAATGKLLLRYGEVMGSEIIVEMYQDSMMTVGQNILAQIEEKPDAHITLEQWRKDMGETIVQTAKAVTIIAGVGPVMSYGGDFVAARRAKNLKVAYQALGEAAKDSKLRQTVATKYREFVDKAAGSVKHILLDIKKFDTYFQDIGMDPDKVAADLKITPEQLAEARAHETYLEIQVGVFAEKLAATEHYDPLSMDLKTDLSQMTGNESATFFANATELEKQWALGEPPEAHKPVQEIIDRIRNQLMANAGRDFSAASKEAAIMEHQFATHAKNNNLDTLELFNQYFGGVQKDIDALERGDVDMNIDPLLDLLRAEKGPKQRDIYGESLIEFLRAAGGLADQGGELAARDLDKLVKNLVIESGLTHDAAAELAAEAGFIAERDPEMLVEAVMREAGGEKAFGRGADPVAANLAKDLDELADLLSQSDIDIQAMDNAEIRKTLAGSQKLMQGEILEIPGALPDNILEEQNFGELEIVMEMEIAGRDGEIVGISRSANAAYQTGVNRLRSMQDLLECLNAA